jgi:hypothetical protein
VSSIGQESADRQTAPACQSRPGIGEMIVSGWDGPAAGTKIWSGCTQNNESLVCFHKSIDCCCMQTCKNQLAMHVGKESFKSCSMVRKATHFGWKPYPHAVGDKHRAITQGVLRQTPCSNSDRTLMNRYPMGKEILLVWSTGHRLAQGSSGCREVEEE